MIGDRLRFLRRAGRAPAIAGLLLAAPGFVPATAEVPGAGLPTPFPNAALAWRYDAGAPGPAAADGGATAAGPAVSILDPATGAVMARYSLDGAAVCDTGADTCAGIGIFPLVLADAPQDPILVVLSRVGERGRKLVLFRPRQDRGAAVFELVATAGFDLTVSPAGLAVATAEGVRHWPVAAAGAACRPAAPVALPAAPPASPAAAALAAELGRIVRSRDLAGFVALLAEDVLVSFGGPGGRGEFLASIAPEGAEAELWASLEGLLARGGWNDRAPPETMTWPWVFAAWPPGDPGYDAYFGGPDLALHAGPDDRAPLLARLGFGVVRLAPPEPDEAAIDWEALGWMPVATPDHCLGYLRADAVTPLLGRRLVARREGPAWTIEAFVSGD